MHAFNVHRFAIAFITTWVLETIYGIVYFLPVARSKSATKSDRRRAMCWLTVITWICLGSDFAYAYFGK